MDRDRPWELRPWELIARIAEFVSATDGRGLAEVTLKELAALAKSCRVALYARNMDAMQLFTSRGINESVIELVRTAWRDQRENLEAGKAILARAPGETPTLEAALHGVAAVGLFPLMRAGRLIGVLYVDTVVGELDEAVIARLMPLAVIALGTPVPANTGNIDKYLERMSPDEIERDQLLLHLNNNEWNIARVARLMGITRRTIYMKLARYGIPRKKISKAELRSAIAAAKKR